MHTAGSLIDDLGGTEKVSATLGLAPSTVSGWRVRGIPPSRWLALVGMAAERGRDDVTFELLATLPVEKAAEARA